MERDLSISLIEFLIALWQATGVRKTSRARIITDAATQITLNAEVSRTSQKDAAKLSGDLGYVSRSSAVAVLFCAWCAGRKDSIQITFKYI